MYKKGTLGLIGTVLLAAVVVMSPSTESTATIWEYGVPMQTGRCNFGVAVGTDGLIYAIGGYVAHGAIFTETVERFNEATQQWQYVASLPYKLSGVVGAVDAEGWIYAIGGQEQDVVDAPHDTVLRYDYVADSWSPVAPMILARTSHTAVTDDLGRIYALGGVTDGMSIANATNRVERYDPMSDTWTEMPEMNDRRAGHASFIDSQGRIYAAGGGAPDGSHYSTVERLDPANPGDGWQYVSPMHEAKYTQGTVGPDGRFYVAGGWLPGYTNTVECYDPLADTWTYFDPIDRSTNNMGMITSPSGLTYILGGDTGDPSVEIGRVPEPATMLMLGCLGAGMAAARKVRRNRFTFPPNRAEHGFPPICVPLGISVAGCALDTLTGGTRGCVYPVL